MDRVQDAAASARFDAECIPIGTILDGKYEVQALIGMGGMGVVYKAHHIGLSNSVAIKVVRPTCGDDGDALRRFQREARIIAGLRHTNILSVYAFGQVGPLTYMAMELVEGPSLAEVLAAQGAIKPEKALPILLQVCSAMQFAHEREVLHRDLKPSNIIISGGTSETTADNQCAKVVDFGLARLTAPEAEQRLTQTGDVVGDPFYMSPEQCRGLSALDCRSDIYSFGCTMYEVLSGERPFPGESSVAVLFKQISQTPPPFAKEAALPMIWEEIALKCLSKKPEQRFQSFAELAAALKLAADNPGMHLDGSAVKARAISWNSKTNLIAVAASALVIGAGVIGWHAKRVGNVEVDVQQERLRALIYKLRTGDLTSNRYDPAFEQTAHEAAALAEKLGSGQNLGYARSMLARIYQQRLDKQKTYHFSKAALSVRDFKGTDRQEATLQTANAAKALNRWEEAERYYEILYLDPKGGHWRKDCDDSLRAELIAMKLHLGKVQEAEKLARHGYQKSMPDQPDSNSSTHSQSAYALGTILLRQGNPAEAKKVLDTADLTWVAEADKANPNLLLAIETWCKLKNFDEIQRLQKEVMVSGIDPTAKSIVLERICACLMADGHYARSRSVYAALQGLPEAEARKVKTQPWFRLQELQANARASKHELVKQQGRELLTRLSRHGGTVELYWLRSVYPPALKPPERDAALEEIENAIHYWEALDVDLGMRLISNRTARIFHKSEG